MIFVKLKNKNAMEVDNYIHLVENLHNIIQSHNNVMQDWQYCAKYSPFKLNVRNIPHNTISPT